MATTLPWERMENEPEQGYKQFLIYLGMGPARSLLETWRIVASGFENASPKDISEVPGHFRRTADRWNWEERAMDHNSYTFKTKAMTTTYGFVELLDITIAKLRDHVQNNFESLTKKMSLPQLIEAINAISAFVPQSVIQQLYDNSRDAGAKPRLEAEPALLVGPGAVRDGSAEVQVHPGADEGRGPEAHQKPQTAD